jgi:peptide chain release factor 1
VIVEIRQGVGGDEAAIWAGDLYRAPGALRRASRLQGRAARRQPERRRRLQDVTFAISGDGAYSVFKWEGGTHRVQRVPETESQGTDPHLDRDGRGHAEAEEVEVEIDPNDLKIDVYRSTGPGGQSVNTTDSAVRITHLPTGLVVSMQDEKSQLQNRQKALRVLRARLYELERGEAAGGARRDARSQIGSGERAEKIRTYNFPENRITDHRIKLTTHQLDRVLQGELDEFTEALTAEDRRRALGE